eukprot:1193528-Prorocentrum_minimum.AAC.2
MGLRTTSSPVTPMDLSRLEAQPGELGLAVRHVPPPLGLVPQGGDDVAQCQQPAVDVDALPHAPAYRRRLFVSLRTRQVHLC